MLNRARGWSCTPGSPLSCFHNGLAATLQDVVALYQTSLGFLFTRQEAADRVAFLQAL
jgi:cytochrome c peroxidase